MGICEVEPKYKSENVVLVPEMILGNEKMNYYYILNFVEEAECQNEGLLHFYEVLDLRTGMTKVLDIDIFTNYKFFENLEKYEEYHLKGV